MTTPTFGFLPTRRRPDPELLAMMRGAHVSLVRPEHQPTRGSETSLGQLTVAIVLAIAILGSAGAAMANTAPFATVGAASPSCAPVHYVVNPDRAPAGTLDAIHEAFRRLSQATGIRLVYDGESAQTPTVAWTALPAPGVTPVLVVWATREELARLLRKRGVAGFTSSRRDNDGLVVGGTVYLNADMDLSVALHDRGGWEGVVMHEAGHLVGLEHAPRRTEMMFPKVIPGSAEWGPVDRQLLRQVGQNAGCAASPSIRD